MKLGEIITIERPCNASTGVYSVPVRLSNVALLGVDVFNGDFKRRGESSIYRYVFQFIALGKAEIQFAQYCIHDIDKNIVYEDIMSYNVERDCVANDACGGWSDFEDLTDEDLKQFEEVMGDRVGATFTPLKVSKQVVDGVKCRFICIERLATLGRETFPALVEIYYPVSGEKPSVEIKRVML